MYPHCHPSQISSRAYLNWADQQASLGREDHAVRPRFLPCVRGCPTPFILYRFPMLCLPVPCPLYRRHLLPTLPELHLSLLPILVGRSLSHHPLPVRSLRLCPRRLEWAAEHINCLPDISPQDHPIVQANQG